ncbi:MAG: hypothetical protein ABJA82_08625 [Myxococcales bacterium]
MAKSVGTKVIKAAVRAPNMNPVGERFVGSLRREALDHVFLLGADHLARVGRKYADYFNPLGLIKASDNESPGRGWTGGLVT